MPDDLDRIRQAVDIVELIGERVVLKRSGRSLKGLCPFHTEKTPSFYVYPDSQSYYCFGCKASGDLFDWVQRSENVDFRESLEILARRAGIQLSRGSAREAEVEQRRFALMEEACKFFREALPKSEEAAAYAASRGLDGEAVEQWEIGYAPDEHEAFAAMIKRAGFTLSDGARLSLVAGSESEGYRAYFRHRLIFPIRNARGRLVAFGGRALPGVEPKYMNSRETPLFRKRATLYGMHLAKTALLDERHVLIAEGYLDVIACRRAGLDTAVAPLGTSLTREQVSLLSRKADRATLIYDGDEPGRKAAESAAETLRAEEIRCRIAMLNPGDDPDTLLRREGRAALRERVEEAVTPLRFAIEGLKLKHRAQPGISDPAFWESVKRRLASAAERMDADQLVAELAPLHPNAAFDLRGTIVSLKAEVDALRTRKGRTLRRTALSRPPEQASMTAREEQPKGAERILLRAALDPDLRHLVWDRLGEALICTGAGRKLADALTALSERAPNWNRTATLNRLEPTVQAAFSRLESPAGDPLSEQVVAQALKRLERERDRRDCTRRLMENPEDPTLHEEFRRLRSEI
ncbi:MAG: DNA primase [Armatimonadetes bacterium]|nr:DNA primase [Armatimonadota bacterium]